MVTIKWTRKANLKRLAFFAYGEQEFGLNTVRKMDERLMSYLSSLAQNPKLGPIEPLLENETLPYRSLVVHKLIKLIYRIDESASFIYIVDFWDTRREPSRLARLLSRK